jgi:hypothetical protein
MLVATRSFVDPTDGQPIEAGLTHVAPSADVARMFPESFKPASSRRSGPIIRDGGSVALVDPRSPPGALHRMSRSPSSRRRSPEGHGQAWRWGAARDPEGARPRLSPRCSM